MTAPSSIDPTRFLHEQLAAASRICCVDVDHVHRTR